MKISKLFHWLYKDQSGQTLIMVIMIMFTALFIGITISSRYIKGIRALVRTDDVTKATGTAEALIERLLLVSAPDLESYINNNNCGSNCTVSVTDSTGQLISASATLSFVGNSAEAYPLSVPEQGLGSVNLTGYTTGKLVYVCWNGTTSLKGSYIYTQSGVYKATPFAYNAVFSYDTTNGFSASSANFGYENCFSINASQTPIAIRLMSVYGKSEVKVLPEPGYMIPTQGIKIVATGTAGSSKKIITVIKSTDFASEYFDYVLFQKSWDQTLSN